MLPKSVYMRLTPKQKAAHKRKLSRSRSRSTSKSRTYSSYKRPYKKVKLNVPARIGRMAGQYLGNKVHHLISGITGSGDYKVSTFPVKSNSLVNLEPGNSPPKFSNYKGNVRVQHREYIKDIYSGPTSSGSNTTFNIESYALNPGILTTFPWFSSVATNFECYRIRGMLFEFKSMSADALTGTNTALGTVIMATQYNAGAPAFQNKQQMENYEYAQSCKPADSMCHYIECEKGAAPLTELYVRAGSVNTNINNIQMYDMGNFFIATQGMQATSINLGELWVTYDVELIKPKLTEGSTGGSVLWNTYYFDPTKLDTATGKWFPTTGNFNSGEGNMINGIVLADRTITISNGALPGATFLIVYRIAGSTGGSLPTTPVVTLNYGTFVNLFDNGTTAVCKSYDNKTGDNANYTETIVIAIKLTAAGNAQIQMPAATSTVVDYVAGSLTITQLNNSIKAAIANE